MVLDCNKPKKKKRMRREKTSTSPSSSIDSNSNHSGLSSASFSVVPAGPRIMRDLSTDLQLGLAVSISSDCSCSCYFPSSSLPNRKQLQPSDCKPSKPSGLLKKALAAPAGLLQVDDEDDYSKRMTLFVKVYMEGVPIGRKIDLLALQGYHDLITTLRLMFNTTIFWAEGQELQPGQAAEKCHILTYEDSEGDWMIVGDVPWEMFLSTVKRLKITRIDYG